jgi:N-acetylglucosamine-6-phosphate deacetylase
MRPIHHREPGPVIALLEDPRVCVELIADGIHVDAALYRHVSDVAGPNRVSLVTDAMAAAGMSDGDYRIGPLAVDVTGGVAHLAGTDTIAGSTATMDRLFRFAVAHSTQRGGLSRDEALLRAVRQSSITPAAALGLRCPVLQPGAIADLVILDSSLQVSAVMARGVWVSAA